jgi:hypothetical protein
MPNTPALVGAGAAAIAPGTSAGDADLAWAESILGSVGTVARVSEPLLDAVTGLSGSGPAYIFLVAEALIEAGHRNLPHLFRDLVKRAGPPAGNERADSGAAARFQRLPQRANPLF